MDDRTPQIERPTGDEHDIEVLMTRLVDSEATDEDVARFEHVAASEPTLWRDLALRQRDMVLLTEQVDVRTSAACAVELPGGPESARRAERAEGGRISWMLALSGWAAVFVLALSWFMVLLDRPEIDPGIARAEFTAIDHYEEYVAAPFVMGELPPVVVEVQDLPDGRVAVHFIRRVEEVALLDPEQSLPVDENGELTKDLRRLRRSEPAVGLLN